MLFTNASVEFEGCAVVENDVLVVTGSGRAEGALLSDGHRVDLLCVADDFSDGVSAVPCDAMTVALLPVSDGDDALGVTVPGQVVDSTVDDTVLALCESLANTVPDTD